MGDPATGWEARNHKNKRVKRKKRKTNLFSPVRGKWKKIPKKRKLFV